MEEAVRSEGAIPATIAVLDGEVRIGLSRLELERIARAARILDPAEPPSRDDRGASQTSQFVKANRRDLAAVLSRAGSATTTVSATLWLARRFGSQPCVMATGGIGGVHRGAGESFDISADLDELARADGCLVVCSGLKSILDLPASLEALETRGVLIAGYRTNELPAFTTRSSGLALEHRVDSPRQAAELVLAHRELRLPGALILANPVAETESVPRAIAECAMTKAMEEAQRLGISGKFVTPFLLERIRHDTGGDSLRANLALLVSNARLAAEVAVALACLSSCAPSAGH
jgi:pseudouridine-5'-phosphate glycosidase